MDGDIIAYGDIAADVGGSRVVRHMDSRAVLDIGSVADGDRSDVAADNGIEPYGAFVAHGYIAHDSGVFTEVAVATPLGGHSFVRFNQSHSYVN